MRKFWTSERFYAGVLFALAVYLERYGFTLEATGVAMIIKVIAVWVAGIGTLDRFSENVGKRK